MRDAPTVQIGRNLITSRAAVRSAGERPCRRLLVNKTVVEAPINHHPGIRSRLAEGETDVVKFRYRERQIAGRDRRRVGRAKLIRVAVPQNLIRRGRNLPGGSAGKNFMDAGLLRLRGRDCQRADRQPEAGEQIFDFGSHG